MRHLVTILLIVIGVFSLSAQTAQRWKKVALPSPYNTGYYLDIYFLPSNPSLGWACDQYRGYVVRTTDGGNTWQGTTVTGGGGCHLEYIQFLDANVGYCSGPCGMFKSTDGGATWRSIKPAGSPSMWGGWFRSATEGWFTGGGCGFSTFLRTDDGGTTFTTVTDTTVKRSVMSDPYWASDMAPGEVFAIGSGTLWRSGDDGLTWAVHANTGLNSPWHEELAMVGQAVLIPNAQQRCASGFAESPGMRFSPNRGQTWRDYVTGEPMYGTFLHDTQRGWASGANEAVYYTSDAGQTWTKRSCGLDGADTDDIFFLDGNNGWVVGEGIFRTAPALRTQSDSTFRFSFVCPDSTGRDTVRVRNVNWFSSPISASIIGPDATMFSIANGPIPTSIGSCAFQDLIVTYRPTTRGAHTATLAVTFQQPDTTLYVQLDGSPAAPTANPSDTILTFTGPVGQPLNKTLTWRSSSSTLLESIVSISYASGDSTVSMAAARYPEIVRSDVTLTYISCVPKDTGWTQTRFRVRLGPCPRDTFITVRIYGLSPIITTVTGTFVSAACKKSDTLRIPMSNTGNALLEISSLRIDNTASSAFTIVGFTSGRKGTPWRISIGESDTLLIAYIPDKGRDNTTLEIISNDLTRKRGVKSPWYVNLQAWSDRPRLTVDKKIINVGSLCLGSVVERTINVTNVGYVQATISASVTSKNVTVRPTTKSDVIGGQTKQVVVVCAPTTSGSFTDTVFVSVTPCDTVIPVIVTGIVEQPEIVIRPPVIADSGKPNETLRGRAVITLAQGDSVQITEIRVAPLPSLLNFILPTVPRLLTRNDSIVVNFTYSSPLPSEYRGVIEVVGATSCTTRTSSDIRFSVISNEVQITPDTLGWEYQCTKRADVQKISVFAKGSVPVTVLSARRRSSNGPFFITGPGFPLVVNPSEVRTISVLFDPPQPGVYVDTIDIQTNVPGVNVAIPVKGAYLLSTVAADPSTVDLGNAYICEPERSFTVRLVNTGDMRHSVQITASPELKNAKISRTSVSLRSGQSDSVDVQIQPGDFPPNTRVAGRIFIEEVVCRQKDTVFVNMLVLGPAAPLLTPDPLDVGVVTVGGRAVGSVTIENPSSDTMSIIRARIEPPLPEWTLTTPLNGQRIAPSGSIIADFECVPTAAGRSSTRLVVETNAGCADTTTSVITGQGRDPKVPITYRIPLRVNEYTVGPEDTLDIPVYLDANVRDAMLDSLAWTLRYTPVNLTIDSVMTGSALDVSTTADLQPGAVRFHSYRAGASFGGTGSLVILRCRAHSAIPDSTPLLLTDMKAWAAEQTVMDHDDGFVIVDACGPRFLIDLMAKSRFAIQPPLPITSYTLPIRVEAENDDVMDIRVVDALGQVVASFMRVHVGKGLSTHQFDIANLAAGSYSVVIQSNSRGAFTSTVPIVR
ncbi:MAG: hypothetical protein ACKOE4_07940 [Candidatus Kapaibacterium sp.]